MVQTNQTNAFETTLSADMGPTDLVAAVQSTNGSPASPCYLVIEPTNADRREYILFDGTFTANEFATSIIDNRYLSPGSAATSGLTHPAGSIVRFSPVAQHFTDHFTDVDSRFAAKVAKAGDTMTGQLTFNKGLGEANRLVDLQQNYGLYSDNAGPGSAGNRLWVNAPEGGAVYVGPRGGGVYLDELHLRTRALKAVSPNGTADVAKIVWATYTGNGTGDRDIALPFTPGSVVVSWGSGGSERTAWSGAALGAAVRGLYTDGATILASNLASSRPQLGVNKFTVNNSGSAGGLNFTGTVYTYTAIGV